MSNMKATSSDLFDFRIDYKDVPFLVNQDIARKEIPYFILAIVEASFLSGIHKSQCCHVGVYHNLCGRMSIGYAWLRNDRLNSATIETCKAVEGISSVWENNVVHQYFLKQSYNATAVQKVVYLVYYLFCYIGVILIATGAGYSQVENAHHRNPIAISLGYCFCRTLFSLKATYIWLANSRLRFMYCAKSLELIGDCCDAAIFRILRIVASLWNWLRNVIVHIDTWFLLQRYNNFLNMQGIGVQKKTSGV